MFEYHGWATIRESTADDDEIKLLNAVNRIHEYINDLKWDSGVIDLKAVNGEFHFWLSGLDNHRPSGKYDPIEIYKFIGSISPGSYGLLYFKDSDDINNQNNMFKVVTLKRGRIMEMEDMLLSPIIQEIEDEV
ncbi:hypothetical protein HQN90_14500 [Paenibacillus alba]|uniref:Imm7 family immunity protein n=1 Tax=Paenibacillus alba TaxID=1197127 RepID=UPI0015641469|nr:Imm7 family immunity protein [Paenibacillus alba]NQX67328.1 hypothetical protein [Paenibacillus alba]